MIFSGFNSLVQLFAAVYLTMSFDSQFLRQFWAQDYKKKINDEFNSIEMPEPAKEVSKNYAISTAQYEERRMRKRGTFMFVLMVFLLIVIGFEQGIVSYTGYRGLLFCYLFFSIVMGLLNCFDEDIMKRWLWEYIILFALILLFCTAIITLPFFNCYESVKNEFSFGFKVAVKVLLILTIIAPATVQLFRNWLYGKYYLPQVKSDILEIVNYFNTKCGPGEFKIDPNDIDKYISRVSVSNLYIEAISFLSESSRML